MGSGLQEEPQGLECGPAVGQVHEEDRRSVHSHARSHASHGSGVRLDALQQQLAELAAREAALLAEDGSEDEGPSGADLAAQVLEAIEGEQEGEANGTDDVQPSSAPAAMDAPPPPDAQGPGVPGDGKTPVGTDEPPGDSAIDRMVSNKMQSALQAIARAEETELGHKAEHTERSSRPSISSQHSRHMSSNAVAAGTLPAAGSQPPSRPSSSMGGSPDGHGTPTRSRSSSRPTSAMPPLAEGMSTPIRGTGRAPFRHGAGMVVGDEPRGSSSHRASASGRPSNDGAAMSRGAGQQKGDKAGVRTFDDRGFDEEDPEQVLRESLVVLGEIELLIRDSLGLASSDAPLASQDPKVMERIPAELLDALEETVGVIIDSRAEIRRSATSTPNNSRPGSAASSPAGGHYRMSPSARQPRPMSSTSTASRRGGGWGTPPPPGGSMTNRTIKSTSSGGASSSANMMRRNYMRDTPSPEFLEEQQRRKEAAERRRVQQVQKDLQLIQTLRNKQEESMQKHAEVVQEAEDNVRQLRNQGTRNAAYNKWLEYQETLTTRAKMTRERDQLGGV